MDGPEVAHGGADHPQTNAVIVTDQVPRFTVFSLDGDLLARGRTFENCHNVFTNSRGDFYGVDAQRRQIQRFVKIA